MYKNNSMRRRIRLLAEREEWSAWVDETFSGGKFFWTRESLWNNLDEEMKREGGWTVFEFGVAWGYTTNYWVTKLATVVKIWHGFHRFTGLPRNWRDLDSGAFDAQGQVPAINDRRLVWHMGDVEEELAKVENVPTPKLILFDLDLYEPTHYAWRYLVENLKIGDLIYFDEAFDTDERRVITEDVLSEFNVPVIGFTHSAIALKLEERI